MSGSRWKIDSIGRPLLVKSPIIMNSQLLLALIAWSLSVCGIHADENTAMKDFKPITAVEKTDHFSATFLIDKQWTTANASLQIKIKNNGSEAISTIITLGTIACSVVLKDTEGRPLAYTVPGQHKFEHFAGSATSKEIAAGAECLFEIPLNEFFILQSGPCSLSMEIPFAIGTNPFDAKRVSKVRSEDIKTAIIGADKSGK
jgi:hypothetical protein